MSQAHALSDEQVSGELKKMTAFIRQEALEKAKEIQIKADEEFAIEKSKLVREETSSIDATYVKKSKQAAMSQQITRSTMANKSRLRVLTARQAILDDLFEQARKKLVDFTKDKAKYQVILKNLILQGAYAMNESKLLVRARKPDYEVAKKAMSDAQKEYKQNTNKDVTIELDEKNPQPEACSGGISVVGGGGKIDINNTFEERLHLLETDALPSVRATLFGPNENRRFYD